MAETWTPSISWRSDPGAPKYAIRLKVAITILLLLQVMQAKAQFYLRGELRDESGKPVANAKIVLRSAGYVYFSGSSGGFGITSSTASDSIDITADGFYPHSAKVSAQQFAVIPLKTISRNSSIQKPGLSSFTKGFVFNDKYRWTVGTETYSSLLENEFIETGKFPETGFAVNIHKASYSNIRRFLNMESPVPPDAVRLEEVLNYFNFNYKAPPRDSIWAGSTRLSDCPWNKNNKLLFLQLSAKKLDMEKVPPGNLVFLIDISGSMDMPNRLPLLKSAFQLMVENLRPTDTVSIVVYGSTVGVWMPPTSGADKKTIKKYIEDLAPGGATAGASGILFAYALAKNKFIPGGNNRVILATDGDFNVGQTSDKELEELIVRHRMEGIYLTCLGVGMGNYKDSKLEMLAKRGNGNFAYLDHEKEAEKVLVTELTQTLYAVANDVFVNLKFDPEQVAGYRLIGFDNKLNALNDSTSELEGGEVGSGHSLMAMVELSLKHPPTTGKVETALGRAEIAYRLPNDSITRRHVLSIEPDYKPLNEMDGCHRMATSLVMFGSMLKASPYTKNITWNEVQALALGAVEKENPLHTEYLRMLEQAKKIYSGKKKRKRSE